MIARSAGERVPSVRRIGALEIDGDGHRAAYAGRPLALSLLEFALLARLGERPARVHTKQALLRDIWGLCRRRHKPHYADRLVMPTRG